MSAPQKRTRAGVWVTAALLTVSALALWVLAGHLPWRYDLTDEGLYTLDPATRGLLTRLEDRLQVKLYFNRNLEGVEDLLPQRLLIEDFLAEAKAAGGERISIETVDPTTDLVAQRDAEHVGITPLQITTGDVGEVGVVLVYQGLEMRYQDRSEVIPFTVPSELEFAFAARLASLLRPRRPEIAFFSRESALGPPIPGMPRRIPQDRIYQELRGILVARATIRDVSLEDPAWREADTAALIVARPESMTAAEIAALDAYLAEGGRVLLLVDTEQVDPVQFVPVPLDTGLDAWLAGWGVRIGRGFVHDERCLTVTVGYETLETQSERQQVPIRQPYGMFPVIQGAGLNHEHAVTAAIGDVTGFWMHPVEVKDLPPGISAEVLLKASPDARVLPADAPLTRDREVQQRVRMFARQSGPGREVPLAVAFRGIFSPQLEHANLKPAPGVLVVVGDSDLFHNVVLNNQEAGGGNAALAANFGDWLSGDESLIGLRSRGRIGRRLEDLRNAYIVAQGGRAQTVEENQVLDREAKEYARSRQRTMAWMNVVGPPLGVGLLALLAHGLRRARSRRGFSASSNPGKERAS